VAQSFAQDEGSANPGGIPYRYVLKALIPIGFTLFALQSVADAIKALRLLRTSVPAPQALSR
jgi:TRAP-type mannitol/chloroaromatic compound transport system permease small subunit